MAYAEGKQRLIDAALKLSAEKRSFANIGLRELAREAQLNPNTFYRHFESLDDLGICMIEDIGDVLSSAMREVRRQKFDPLKVNEQSLTLFFDFVLQYQDSLVVAACERYSTSPPVRQALESRLDKFAQEIADDVSKMGGLLVLPRPVIGEVMQHITHHCFRIAVDYIEQPEQRAAIFEETRRYISMLFLGAIALENNKQ
jgi:AcrR family transcriptional regulator